MFKMITLQNMIIPQESFFSMPLGFVVVEFYYIRLVKSTKKQTEMISGTNRGHIKVRHNARL